MLGVDPFDAVVDVVRNKWDLQCEDRLFVIHPLLLPLLLLRGA